MGTYVVARLLAIIPTLLLLMFVVLLLGRLLPGDAVDALMAKQAASGGSVAVTPADREVISEKLGLNHPLWEAYGRYAFATARGNLGTSLWVDEPVRDLVAEALPRTLVLTAITMAFSIVTGIAIGVLSAAIPGSMPDILARSVSILGLSIPNFAVATLIVILPTIWWSWSPPLHYTPLATDHVGQYLWQFIAPAFSLSLGLSAIIMRMTRTQMLEVLRQDYVRTARAKGLGGTTTLVRHALPNALIPVVSAIGLQVAVLISGAVIVESIFGIPGVGRLLITALRDRDYPVIQGIAVVVGVLVVLINLVVDISYSILDPRIRLSEA